MSTKTKTKITIKNNKKLDKLWHPETGLVFKSKEEKVIVGRIVDDEFIPLNTEIVELATKWDLKCDTSLLEELAEEENDEDEDEEEEEVEEVEEEVEETDEPPVEENKENKKEEKKVVVETKVEKVTLCSADATRRVTEPKKVENKTSSSFEFDILYQEFGNAMRAELDRNREELDNNRKELERVTSELNKKDEELKETINKYNRLKNKINLMMNED